MTNNLTELEAAFLATFRTKISDAKRCRAIGVSHEQAMTLGASVRAKLGLADGASLRGYLTACKVVAS